MQKEVIYISEIRLKTSVTYKGTGSQTQYDFPFDYLRKSFIKVTIDDVLQDTSDYNVDNRSILFNTAPAADSIIVIYRETDTERLVSWADASVLKASDMTISQVQQLHILEEGQDWSKLNSIYLDETDKSWEGNNHKIKNVSYPVNDNDVVTKGYMETVQGGFVMANTALKDEATKQAGIATTKASEASTSASAAATSETNAASSANMAKRWAEASDSPDNTTSKSAKTWASEASTSASAAKASETNAKSSETNAKSSETKAANSATTATEKAGIATTKASEASASASAAKTSETNAKNYSENVNVFLPSVSAAGVLSWTNKAGLPNPASVNIKGAKGDKGDTGNAATIEVGTVTTGAAGSSASVVNRGDANNAILDFILPKGADGKGSVITVNGKEPDANGNVEVSTVDVSSIVDIIYPVGSIYMSMSATNPAEFFGGTWEQIAQGRCLIGAGTGTDSRSESKTFTAGATGGEYNHVITVGELASHTHSASSSSIKNHNHSTGILANIDAHLASGLYGFIGSEVTNKTINDSSSSHVAREIATSSNGSHSHTITVNNNGSNTAHNNIMPYLAVYYFKRTA